jgi:hypothetical protein
MKACKDCENYNTMTCEGCSKNNCWQKKIDGTELKKNTRLEERRKNIPDSITQKVDEQYNRIVNADIEEAFKSEAARDYWLTDEKIKEIILDYTKWYYDMYTLPNYGTDEVIADDYIKYKNNIKKEE